MHRLRRPVALVALALAVVVGGATPAGAHAEVRESDPPAGGEAEGGLDRIELVFIEMDPSGPMTVEVFGPGGDDVVSGDLEIAGQTMTIPVQPLEVGEHRVVWEVVAADGDGTSDGEFAFTVVEPAGGGFGIWLVWIVALGILAAIFLRPGARKKRSST